MESRGEYPVKRQRLVLLAVLVVLLCAGLARAQGKTVLVIYSYDEGLAWTRQCDQGIRESLPPYVTIKRIYMDTKRIPAARFPERAQEVLREFEQIRPDLVMLSDDNALQLVGPAIAATGTPVVYFGINGNPRDYFEFLPKNVTGIIERIPLFRWVRVLLDVVPKTTSVLVLADDSRTADAIIEASFKQKTRVNISGVDVYWAKAESWEEWQRYVLEEPCDFIVMPIYHALKDSRGTPIPYDEVIRWTSRNSRVPVFASQDYAVADDGVVGSLVIVGEEHGRLAGKMAKAILEGVPDQYVLTADDQKGVFYFNKYQLKRYGLVLTQMLRDEAEYR